MCLSKKKRNWRRSARSALAVGAITVTTFVSGPAPAGEILDGFDDLAWRNNPAVQEALAAASSVTVPGADQGTPTGTGGVWFPLTGVEHSTRAIYR